MDAPDTRWNCSGRIYPTEPPAASAVLMFSHGGALRLISECLECELADLGRNDLAPAMSAKAPNRRDWTLERWSFKPLPALCGERSEPKRSEGSG